jgi:hypothetical protein
LFSLTCLLSPTALVGRELDGFGRLPELGRLDHPRAILVEPELRLERVRPDEILSGAVDQAISLGTWTRGGAMPDLRIGELRVVRTISSVWRMRVPDEEMVGALEVRFEMTAPDGRTDCLALTEGDDSEIRTILRSTPPVMVSRDAYGTIVEGGLTLYLDLDAVRTAGTYSGTLTVTIDHF